MIFSPFVAIPAESDARDEGPKSHHITKRDIKKWAIIIVAFFVIILWPVYAYFKRLSDKHVCASNMNAIYKALSLYANDHDDRFPPLASMNPSTGVPNVENGKVNTWITQIFQYDQRPNIYRCPAAHDEELVANQAAIKKGDSWKLITVWSSYGMYAAYSAASQSLIDQQGQVVFISETSNNGSQQSYDPLPFKDSAGQTLPYDGFSMAWDNSNVEPSSKSRFITRLALPGSDEGDFRNAGARHGNIIHAIAPDGTLRILGPADAAIPMRGGEPSGMWHTPPTVGSR